MSCSGHAEVQPKEVWARIAEFLRKEGSVISDSVTQFRRDKVTHLGVASAVS